MKIITFNIWDLPVLFVKKTKKRVLKIADYLQKSGADIICLQESFNISHRIMINQALLKAGYRASDEKFENRRIFFLKKMDTTGGLVVFSKFPVIENFFVPFSRILNASIFEYFGRKGFLVVVLKTPFGKIRIVNTHLHSGNRFFKKAARIRQLKKIMGYLKKSEPLPTVLSGDLNENSLRLEEDFFRPLKDENFASFLKQPFEPSYRAENPYVNNWINRISESRRFDYIFFRGFDSLHLSASEYRADYPVEPLSDHDPVVLTLSKIGV